MATLYYDLQNIKTLRIFSKIPIYEACGAWL